MRTKVRTIRPPFKTHGGKWYGCRFILPMLEATPHHRYIEAFGGGFSVGLNKTRVTIEHYNDLDWFKVAMFITLRDRAEDFLVRVKGLTYDVDTFLDAKNLNETHKIEGCSLTFEAAIPFFVRSRMSRGGMGKTFAWSERLRGGQPGDVNSWMTILKEIPKIAERIQGLHTTCVGAAEIIESHGQDADTLIYCDAPYPHSTRTATKVYDFEMTDAQHKTYLHEAVRAKCKVAISSYQNEMYDTILDGWRRVDFELPNHAGQSKTKERRIECVYLNYKE